MRGALNRFVNEKKKTTKKVGSRVVEEGHIERHE